MPTRNQTRLHTLCSRALVETDPQKLSDLLIKIDDILFEKLAELSAMFKEVEQVLSGIEQLSRIHLIKKIEAPRLHEVAFYSDDRRLLEHGTQFVGAALKTGGAAILIATESHRESLLPRLQAFGIDIEVAIEQGRYVALDVVDALATFIRNGKPDPAVFMKLFGQLILTVSKATRAKQSRVVIFGEGVHLLCAQGNAEAAIQIEKLCNQLIEQYHVDILCSYFPHRIAESMDSDTIGRICEEHSAVHSALPPFVPAQ